jgi:hypothetical protein
MVRVACRREQTSATTARAIRDRVIELIETGSAGFADDDRRKVPVIAHGRGGDARSVSLAQVIEQITSVCTDCG